MRVLAEWSTGVVKQLSLYCGKCGVRVGSTANPEAVGHSVCHDCGVELDAERVIGRPSGGSFGSVKRLDDEARSTVITEYCDRLVEVAELDHAQELEEELDAGWSIYDPLLRRRVDELPDVGANQSHRRTQWIFTHRDNDEEAHIHTSRQTYYFYRAYLPLWGQEEVALSCGLDGHAQWAAYRIVEKEFELLREQGVEVEVDDLDFLAWVCDRHHLKFDACELRYIIQLVGDRIYELQEAAEEAREQYVRDMVYKYYCNHEVSVDVENINDFTVDNWAEASSWFDEEKVQAVEDELAERGLAWLLDHEQAEWFSPGYEPSFESVEAAEAHLAELESSFEQAWTELLEDAEPSEEVTPNVN